MPVLLMAKRLNANVSDSLYDAVTEFAYEAGVTRSDLISGLLQLWNDDYEGLRTAVIQPAKSHRREIQERQYDRSG